MISSGEKNVMYLMRFTVMVAILSVPAFSQSVAKKTSHPSKNTILFEVLRDLAPVDVCGGEPDSREIYAGTVMKRDFSEDETRLSGFVLRSSDDSRQYVNLDFEYISGRAASASSGLADWLIKGRKLKVFVYRCSRILYAYKIVGM